MNNNLKSFYLSLMTLGALRKLSKTWKDLKPGGLELINSTLNDSQVVLVTDYEIRVMTIKEEEVLYHLLEIEGI